MEITKELIEKRKAELQTNREQLIAALNAHNGALLDCDYWLLALEHKVDVKE